MRTCLAILLLCVSNATVAVDLNGRTEFNRILNLTSGISAHVVAVDVRPGQRVRAGDRLLQLDRTLFDADVALAQARIGTLEPAEQDAATELDKARELFDRDSLALVELQRAEQNHAIALARLDAARAELAKAQHRLAQTEVHAPIDAVVLTTDAFVGQFVNTRAVDTVLITLGADRPMQARALLPLELSGKITPGQEARVRYGERGFRGRVVAIGHRITAGANNHPALELTVEFDAGNGLPANLPVNISLDEN